MLPVGRKPIVQYVAEELTANGVEQILFITGRSKTSIENHFDSDPELARVLAEGNKNHLLEEIRVEELGANLFYTRQRQQRGLGDAIMCGESFAGEQPFIVALGDSIIGMNGQSQCVSRLAELFVTMHASCIVAVEEVPKDEVPHYGVIDPGEGEDDWVRVRNLVEKPAPENAPSNLAIAGRYAFSPLVFDMLRRVAPDARGEIQLTDAIQLMCEEGKRVLALKLPRGQKRYDIGNFPSYFETFVEFALADPTYGEGLRMHLERLLGKNA
jgi:UTP--glucose-1-phosphate uridylyltransferase